MPNASTPRPAANARGSPGNLRRPLVVRTYYRSFWLWLRWIVWLLLLLFVVGAGLQSRKQPVGGMIASGVFAVLFLYFLYLMLKTQPYAIRIHPDRFEVCSVLERKTYFFTNVAEISLDEVHTRKSGDIPTVRVDFHKGRHLQLGAMHNRRKFFEDLHECWRVAKR